MENDEKIKKLLKAIDEKKAKLGTKPIVAWVTKLVWKDMDGNQVNINTINDIGKLVFLFAGVLSYESHYAKAEEALGAKNTKHLWNGFTAAEWTKDLKSRVSLLQWEEEEKELKKLTATLKDLRSEGAKTTDALDDIAGKLS